MGNIKLPIVSGGGGNKIVNEGPIGGRIFYIDDTLTPECTYEIYDSASNLITDWTVSGLANASRYKATYDHFPTVFRGKFYVYDNTTHTTGGKTANSGLVESIYWGYYKIITGAKADSIGSGKTNTATILSITDTSSYSDSIFKYCKACNDANLNDRNDWYIASEAEQDKLRTSGLVNWYSNKNMWSSVESTSDGAYVWNYNNSTWLGPSKGYTFSCVLVRSF